LQERRSCRLPRGEKMAMGIGNESPYPMTNDETGLYPVGHKPLYLGAWLLGWQEKCSR
jgi:hypothetical protein